MSPGRPDARDAHDPGAAVARPPGRPLVAAWGALSVVAVLAEAAVRLGRIAVEAVTTHTLTAAQWALLVAWTVAIGYAEGYRAFHRSFAPRVAARAMYLAAHPRPLHVALAPLYCMALLHTSRRRLVANWVLVAAIVAMAVGLRHVPQPYRGIVDAGVAVALFWGAAVIVVHFARGLRGAPPPVDPDVP